MNYVAHKPSFDNYYGLLKFLGVWYVLNVNHENF